MRLIDANALAEQFKTLAERWRSSFSGVAYQNAYERIKDAPTVDAAPVVHGRWDHPGKHDWCCSVCKRGVPWSYTGFHYCPNCGAKMDLKE